MDRQTFSDRAEAGRLLGQRVSVLLATAPAVEAPLVLGLPRGGVVVAAHAAVALGVPVEVFVARKIGHPRQPEYGLGAIAEGGEPVFDELSLAHAGLVATDLGPVVAAERQELARRVAEYRPGRDLPPLAGRTVVLVDDGVATGVTARAALRALRSRGPGRLLFAAPVAARQSVAELAAEADEIVVLASPAGFGSVGRWYVAFPQVSDAEVVALLTPPGRQSL
jgi:putative phosphoribosyl transferase